MRGAVGIDNSWQLNGAGGAQIHALGAEGTKKRKSEVTDGKPKSTDVFPN
jgi:hypothetical protein